MIAALGAPPVPRKLPTKDHAQAGAYAGAGVDGAERDVDFVCRVGRPPLFVCACADWKVFSGCVCVDCVRMREPKGDAL